jgi:hypothetical protein
MFVEKCYFLLQSKKLVKIVANISDKTPELVFKIEEFYRYKTTYQLSKGTYQLLPENVVSFNVDRKFRRSSLHPSSG